MASHKNCALNKIFWSEAKCAKINKYLYDKETKIFKEHIQPVKHIGYIKFLLYKLKYKGLKYTRQGNT